MHLGSGTAKTWNISFVSHQDQAYRGRISSPAMGPKPVSRVLTLVEGKAGTTLQDPVVWSAFPATLLRTASKESTGEVIAGLSLLHGAICQELQILKAGGMSQDLLMHHSRHHQS